MLLDILYIMVNYKDNLVPRAYHLSGSGEFAAFLPTRKAICPGNEVAIKKELKKTKKTT